MRAYALLPIMNLHAFIRKDVFFIYKEVAARNRTKYLFLIERGFVNFFYFA